LTCWQTVRHELPTAIPHHHGAMDLLRPLVKAGLVKRVGTLKTGRYVLK
jgi:hypothetical protein